MTKQELDKLTPEEKRVRIAEKCGWTNVDSAGGPTAPWGYSPHETQGYGPIPSYLNDLNAMHGALLAFGQKGHPGRVLFNMNLAEVCGTEIEAFPLINATAAQRADAFLLTVG